VSPETGAALGEYGHAFAVAGSVGMTITFVYLAAERKAPSLADRGMFVVLVAALTAYALGALGAHEYGRAFVCALIIAMVGAAARAAMARAPRPARTASAPRHPDGTFAARGRRWGRALCACPECEARRRPRPYH